MDYDSNVYYHPEKHGLSVVAELEFGDGGGYGFDFRVVWQDANGLLYTARDSGCSCPSPFEDYDGIASLDRVGPDFRNEVRAECDAHYNHVRISEFEDFIRDVDKAMGVIEQPGVLRQS